MLVESVAFDSPDGVTDALGGQTTAWSQAHACRATFLYQRGGEQVAAARLAGRRSFKIKVRSCVAARAVDETYRMRDLRRGPLAGVSGDTLPGERYNVVEVDAITDRAWVYIVIEGPLPSTALPVMTGPGFDSGFDQGFG